MPRSYLVNAVDVALAAPVAAPDLTITVDDASPLPTVPFYLVVDPFNTTDGREYMLCTAVNGNILTVDRDLAGSESDTHLTGDVVRISYVAQILDDLWDEIETASGLPAGGVLGDSLRKQSATEGDAAWDANVTFDVSEPVSPILGDFWMDPDAVLPAATFLRLDGASVMTGDIDAGGNDLINVQQVLSEVGSESVPSISSAVDPTTGIYQGSAATISFSISGTRMLLLTSVSLSGLITGTPGLKLDAAGTAASPAYGFVGNPGIGMYRSATDELSFATLATPILTLTSAGADFTVPAIWSPGDNDDGYIAGIATAGRQRLTLGAGVSGVGGQARIEMYGPDDANAPDDLNYYGEHHAWHTLTATNRLNLDSDLFTSFVQVQIPNGTQELPSITLTDVGTGMYRFGTAQIGFSAAGVATVRIGTGNFFTEPQLTDVRFRGINSFITTGNAANLYCSTGSDNGRLYRSTSSERFKQDIHRDLDLASLPIPSAARWRDRREPGYEGEDFGEYVGYVAEDWEALDERFVVRDEDGEVMNFHDRSAMAVLGEHIRALEAKVDALENA
jgi:hypothetical protein